MDLVIGKHLIKVFIKSLLKGIKKMCSFTSVSITKVNIKNVINAKKSCKKCKNVKKRKKQKREIYIKNGTKHGVWTTLGALV